jgi:photosystem II stability/assembly factor-like uncharacterized protein
MLDRRCIYVLFIGAAFLAGCRGGLGNNTLPPATQPFGGASSNAGSIAFKPIGPTHMSDGFPTSGKVNAVAVNPTNSKIIYAASGRGTGLETYSSAGVLRTTDGGNSWAPLTDGLVDSSGRVVSAVNSLWIDPKNPSVLLAASEYDGIFRTSDGGSSWTNVFNGGHATEFASYGKAIFATDDAGILTSGDDGKTWSVQLPGTAAHHPTAIGAVEGSNGNALYAGFIDGYIYAYSGGAWTKTGRLPFTLKTGTAGSSRMVHQIAVDPFTPNTLYVSSNDGAWDQNLFASRDGGKTWIAILKNSYYGLGLGTQAIAFSRVHKHQLYLGTDGGFFYFIGDGSPNPQVNGAANLKIIDLRNVWTVANGKDDACWVASDQGLDYAPTCSSGSYSDTVVTASAATGLARRFTLSPDGKSLLVSLQDFDSDLTTNGGSSWQGNFLYEDGFNELRPGDPSACYAYDEAYGLSISTNGCQSFSGSNGSISPSRIMTTPIAFDPKNPMTMYFTSGPNNGPGFSGPKGIFKSTDGGNTVSQLSWPFTWPGAVVVDQKNGKHIIVSDLNKGKSSLSVTADGGKTWTKSSGTIATRFWYAMTISPVNAQTVLASSMDSKNNVFVLRSSDGGKTFKKVATVTNAPLIRGRAEVERRLLRGRGQRNEPESEPSHVEAFVYSPEREIRYNQDVKSGTSDVAITTLRGAFLSTDNGSHWQRIDNGLIAHSFWDIRWLNGYLYLASDGQGVVRSTSAVQSVIRRR